MMIGMVLVFQMPTLVSFLAKMRLVTARAAVLTTTSDPWNQMVFAAPMIALYLLSIVIAWAVRPRVPEEPTEHDAGKLQLVIAATMIDQAARGRRRPAAGEFPRLWRR